MTTEVWRNFSQIVTLDKAAAKDGRNLLPEDLSILSNGSIVFNDKEILWVGSDHDLPKQYHSLPSKSGAGKVLTPAIVDCHTHLIFGGDRASEYALRLNGADYQEIAKAGGGILATMTGTNNLSADELYEISLKRIENIAAYGVKTIEIKSGYGLNREKEYELSKVVHKLKLHFSGRLQIINTYMAAHAVPKDFNSSSDYISKVVIPLLNELAGDQIIDAVDIFLENGYFDAEDVTTLFKEAKKFNIPVKAHVDEFVDMNGAKLGVEHSALSVDHLLSTNDDGIKSLANSNTVATLLPGTGFFLGKPQANARKFLDSGCKVAIGSDYNPGSCHFDNVLQISSMIAPTYKMNQCELWCSITHNAAHALGLKDQGVLQVGKFPYFSIFSTDNVSNITYHWGKNLFFDFFL